MFLLFFFLLFQRRETCSFLVRTRKGRKEAASLRLDRWCNPRVYPVGSRHVFAYHRGTQATAEHAERAASALRKPCACGRKLPSRSCLPHGEWWPVRALQHLSSRGYALPSRRMRVRDSVSVSLLVLFSSVRKAHIFSFGKEETCPFLVRTRKERKETASLRLDR